MLARRFVSRAYNAFLAAQIVAGVAAAVIGAILKADSQALAQRSIALSEFVTWAQGVAWWVLPLLLVLSGTLGFVRKLLGPPWLWKAIHGYLDVFQADAFNRGPDDAQHHHRVTLFKHVGWCWILRRWPWSGWLIAVERSGHTTQTNISSFRAPDDADQAEGVAGMTWARNREVGVTKLPDLAGSPTDDDFRTYAKGSFLSVEQLKKKIPKARSMYGIPVEVKGALWGVIVLDSRSPDGIRSDVQTFYRPLGKFLPKLLERL
jgi:hypothetical protein